MQIGTRVTLTAQPHKGQTGFISGITADAYEVQLDKPVLIAGVQVYVVVVAAGAVCREGENCTCDLRFSGCVCGAFARETERKAMEHLPSIHDGPTHA